MQDAAWNAVHYEKFKEESRVVLWRVMGVKQCTTEGVGCCLRPSLVAYRHTQLTNKNSIICTELTAAN